MAFTPPPLPSAWPFPPRPACGLLERRVDVTLPGLPGVWNLDAIPGLELEGAIGAGLPGAFGRGGVVRAGDLVLRPYRRGGLVRHVNETVYASPARFQREFEVHRALWQAGLPTVEPLGWAHRPKAWGTQGVFLTRFQEGAPWPRAWERTDCLPQVGALLEALCAWGLFAPDLNATNFLLPAAGGLLALDWDGARWAPSPGLAARYQERLVRSLRKLQAPPEVIAFFL